MGGDHPSDRAVSRTQVHYNRITVVLTILLIINIGVSEIVRFVMPRPRAICSYTIACNAYPTSCHHSKHIIINNMDIELPICK